MPVQAAWAGEEKTLWSCHHIRYLYTMAFVDTTPRVKISYVFTSHDHIHHVRIQWEGHPLLLFSDPKMVGPDYTTKFKFKMAKSRLLFLGLSRHSKTLAQKIVAINIPLPRLRKWNEPSCKSDVAPKHIHRVPLELEQDVEMPDISSQAVSGCKPPPNDGASSSKDPIGSFSSAKPSNDDMEIDSDGANPGQPQLKQTGDDHKGIERKFTKKPLLPLPALRSRDLARHDLSVLQLCHRNPLQRTAIRIDLQEIPSSNTLLFLLKVERKMSKLPVNHAKTGKRVDRPIHQSARPKGLPSPEVSSFFQKAVETPIVILMNSMKWIEVFMRQCLSTLNKRTLKRCLLKRTS